MSVKSIRKAIGAFLGTAVVVVPTYLATAEHWWTLLAPFIAFAATWLAPKNAQ